MSGPRVVMVAPGLDVVGGMVTVVRLLLEHVPPEVARLELHPCVGNGSPRRKTWQMAASQVRFHRVLASRPDAVHLHVGGHISMVRELAFALRAKRRGVPCVVHVHGGAYLKQMLDEGGLVGRAARSLLRAASAVVLVTAVVADDVQAIVGPDVPVHVVYNGVDLSTVPDPPDRAGRTGEPIVLFVGWMAFLKGIFDLLDAIPDVPARVRFAGDGADMARFRAEVEKRGLSERLDILGWTTGDDLWRAYAEADIFCLPSHTEGQPMTVLEAMSQALPVVATRVGGIPEQVVEGTTGRLVPPHDPMALALALRELAESPEDRIAMGQAGLERVRRHFAIEVVVEQLGQVWRDATASNRASGI